MVRYAGMNMEQVRLANRSNILSYVNEHGPVSRKDIAAATGLTPAAVTQITGTFLSQKLLYEAGTEQAKPKAGAGRRKVLLALNPDYCHILGINMEPGMTSVALTDMTGNLLKSTALPTDARIPPEEMLERVAEAAEGLIRARAADEPSHMGACLAITGIVDRERGVSVHAYGIWDHEVPAVRILSEKLRMPVMIENNVNAFASAELLFGLGRTWDNLLMVKWGPGVGSTLIIDDSIYEGRHGKAAELGHYIVEKNGRLCSCGKRGCLETRVSYAALSKEQYFPMHSFGAIYRLVHGMKQEPESGTGQNLLTGEKQDGADERWLAEADALSEERRQELAALCDDAVDIFARSIVNVVTIMAPNRVVLYGPMFRDPAVREALISACESYSSSCGPARILYSDLADREDYIGPAAAYIREAVFRSR